MKKFENEYMERNYFDWDKARAFYYVAKIGSITLASKRIHTSQPALSRKISGLEAELNCILLTRSRDGVTLTRRGEEFFKAVEQTFYTMREFHYSDPNKYNNGQKRRIRISTTHAVSAYILSEHLIEYNKLNPHIVFEVITEDHLIDLLINDVDIAIRPHEINTQRVTQEYLFTLEKKLYSSTEYLEKYGEPKTVEDLKNHHVICHAQPEKHPYSDLNWILKIGMSNDEMKQPTFMSNSLENAVDVAKSGQGIIGSYSEMQIIKNSGLKNILPDLKDKPVKWYYIQPNYLIKDKTFDDFKTFIKSKLKK